jgi:death-on-curing protein
MTFGGADVYPSLIEKAAALAYSLVMNHPFVDGNKRVGQMAMEATLLRNGFEVYAPVDDQESASSRWPRVSSAVSNSSSV